MTTYLSRILEAHREAAAEDHRSLEQLIDRARDQEVCRGFIDALRRSDSVAVIAEIKRRSPSRGDLASALDPSDLAQRYEEGGAACLSVLTDEQFFGGSAADLRSASGSVELPVLRKDFTVSTNDVCDARIMGADAILLIAAALDAVEMADFHTLATELGLDVLMEVHDERELEEVLGIGASLVGVNQRDLVTFEVDHDRAARLARLMPDGVVSVAESGIRGREDAERLAEAGYDALLVGETLVTSADVEATVSSLRVARP